MRIMIVTDAWSPQVNGVVRTLEAVAAELRRGGDLVEFVSPDQFRSIPCPTYHEIRLALTSRRHVGARIAQFDPDSIHIATEGPLGLAARGWCLAHDLPFTTAYHTHFPDYLAARTGLPAGLFWRYIRWFHRPSQGIMVATATVAAQLRARGLTRIRRWGRGVDLDLFTSGAAPHPAFAGLPRPLQLYVGRVAVEKGIESFLTCGHPGTRIVVGEGPALAGLRRHYPDALYLGALRGAELASAYAGADVFVFPSRTDTFGLVMIEALASGLPVAAFPVAGPVDILTDQVGAMDEDLGCAVSAALAKDRKLCAAHGAGFTWKASAAQFRASLAPLRGRPAHRADGALTPVSAS